MEFVSGYRDEFLDFTALLFGWFRKFVAERGAVETSLVGHWRQLEAQIRRLPQDPALWVLHVLPNRSVGISLGQGAEPGPGPGLGAGWLLGDQPPLHLRDLSPYVSFVSLEEGEEGEEEEEEEEEEENGEEEGAGTEKVEPEEDGEPVHTSRESPQEANLPGQPEEAEQKEGGGENGYHEERAEDEAGSKRRKGRRSEAAPLHLACLLLVTDEHGTILGIDLLMGGAQRSAGKGSWTENLAPRAYALLCHSMACPMGSGDPRKPRQLTVGDAQLHRGDQRNLQQGGLPGLARPHSWLLDPDQHADPRPRHPQAPPGQHTVPQSSSPWRPLPASSGGRACPDASCARRSAQGPLCTLTSRGFCTPLLAPQDGPEVSVRPGSGVSARLSSGTKEKGGRRDLQIKVSARPYHLLQGPKPDLVIGFNSGFGLKDTWLSSLPRLQVGTGANGDFPHLLPSPCSLPDDDVCFSSIRSAALGAASGPSLCPPRTAPPSPPFWVLRVLPSALPLLLGRSWGQEPPCKSEARLPPTPVPPSARLLHGEQRVRLCDGRADHGRGRRRGHQPPAAQPLPLPVSSPSGRQLHALVLQRLHLPPDLQALAGQRGPRGAGARTPSPDPRRARRPRPEAPRGEEAGARAPPAEVRAGGSGPRLPPPPQASERDIKPVRPRGRPRGRARKR
ncbi:zinc finger MYND domain-containing protein 15 isoform X12 [Pipistrellus kuhlii]|uniref:zinc finger MYND domain-containing protein 15 isoform X12 n=1 Tax=Pipistrellus kuhlii TaxID=59472 RepID=UPI001E2746AC|nr:zinc finger MYND domain-containing protein 15 isoform X12 [Pipistrellus kuhlii]